MNTEQIMALVDAYAAKQAEFDYFKRNRDAMRFLDLMHREAEAKEMADMARQNLIKAIEALQSRDDWK